MQFDLSRDRTGTPPYVTPFLDALDRMQDRAIMRPEQLTHRAQVLLRTCFGAAGDREEAAFSHGGTGLLGEHTHYFNGFATLASLTLGTAVAIRTTATAASRIAFEGGSETWTLDLFSDDPEEWPAWVGMLRRVIRRLSPDREQVEAAVVTTIPSSCVDAYVAALGVAVARSAQALFAGAQSSPEIHRLVQEAAEETLRYPFSIAYVIAADSGRPDGFLLVDTQTLEHLPIAAPSRETLGWGLIDVGMGNLRGPDFHVGRKEMAEEAAELLRRKGFPHLTSLRDLEHRDLTAALEALPRRFRPVVRHLVSENRRVQKLVAAVRRRDWQMLGALLLMSYASVRKDWGDADERIDLVVRETEAMSLEGMHGARPTSRGGCVLVVGQPFSVPRCLDRVQEAMMAQFDVRPNVLLI